MFSALIVSLLIATTAHAAPNPSTEADQPDEVVVLASCNNGQTGAEFQIKDRLFYFPDDYERRKGTVGSQDAVTQDQIHDPTQHDGFTYPIYWNAGTVDDPISAQFPTNKRQFRVWGLPPSDASYATDESVTGAATLDGAPFHCYKGDTSQKIGTMDGFTCTAAFTCTRLQRRIRKTEITIDNATTVVGEAKCQVGQADVMNGKTVFQKLLDVAAHPGTTDYDIGAGCAISFTEFISPDPAGATISSITNILADIVGAKVEEKRKVDTVDCWNPLPGGMGTWHQAKQDQLIYPRGGRFHIFSAQQADLQWTLETAVSFKVLCTCRNDQKEILAEIGAGFTAFGAWISPLFSMTGAAINIASLNSGQC